MLSQATIELTSSPVRRPGIIKRSLELVRAYVLHPDARHLADGHFFGPSNSQPRSEPQDMRNNQSSQATELEADTGTGASMSTLLDAGPPWENSQSRSITSGATISTQANHTPSLASSSSVDAEEPGRGLGPRSTVAVSPATPVDEGNGRTTPRRGESGEEVDTPLSPFADGIPMLDLSRIRIPLAKNRQRTSNYDHPSPDGFQATITTSASRLQGSDKQGSCIPAPKHYQASSYGVRGRSAEFGAENNSRLAKPVKKTSRSMHAPAQADGKAAVSRRISPAASRNVGQDTTRPVSTTDSCPNDAKILPRRAKSLEPKVESDEDDEILLAEAAELSRKELSRSGAHTRSEEFGVGSKRKRRCQMEDSDPFFSSKGGIKLARNSLGTHPSSLEQEMRFAEAQESTAAAIDLVEQHQLQYSGTGTRNGPGFMKGGGAGGRPIWSSIAG